MDNSNWQDEPINELLESPFLNTELFTQESSAEWESHLTSLEAESPFLKELEIHGVTNSNLEYEEAGIIKGDDRVRVTDATRVPWRWICKIIVRDDIGHIINQGTGVLISDRHVLTAAHIVYGALQLRQPTIMVIPALNDLNEPFGSYSIKRKPRISRYFNPDANNSLDWDYALLTLDMAIGKKTFSGLNGSLLYHWGHPQVATNSLMEWLEPATLNGQTGETAGYPGGKGGKQLWHASGLLHSASRPRHTMMITADTTEGQSGSPVWVVKNSICYLVGVAVDAGKNSNTVVRLSSSVITELEKWITEDGETSSLRQLKEVRESPAFGSPSGSAEYYETLLSEWAVPSNEWEATDFGEMEDQEEAVHLDAESSFEEHFDPASVPQNVSEALAQKDWSLALKRAMEAGWRDVNQLTNLIFFARHSELPPQPLDPKDPNFKQLSTEWTNILNNEVWKAVATAAENTDLVVSGKEVIDHHRSFFPGKNGKRLKQLVEEAAREADINPGLLGAVMMAETRRPSSYLSAGKVRSYHVGTDDFYEGRAAIKARVPAYDKVRWDRNQTPEVHYNDAKKPRLIKTIYFDSGAAAALATAVYLKFGEARLREIAAELGGNFDSLTLPTKFALTRMAMAAGVGGATPYLKSALSGTDIFIRQAIPVKAYQTQRNATVRTAQAMHLSDWVFGIPVPAATVQPELENFHPLDSELEDIEEFEFESDLGEEEIKELDAYVDLEEEVDDVSSAETLDPEFILTDEENDVPREAEEIAELEDQQPFNEFEEVISSLEAETAEGLTKKLKYLSLLPHTVEVNGTDVPLTQSVMDPGIYDGPVKYKVAPRLQECLMGVMNRSAFRHISTTLVDLTKNKNNPEFAGFNHKAQVYIASVAKLIPMLAAFQLRHDLRVALNQKRSNTLDELYAAVRDDWAATQLDPRGPATPLTLGLSIRGKLVLVKGSPITLGDSKAPLLKNIFANVAAGTPLAIDFKSTGETKSQLQALVDEYHTALSKVSRAKRALDNAKDSASKHSARQGLATAEQEFAQARKKLDDLGFLERMRLMVGGDVPVSNYITFTVVGDLGYLYMASTLLQSGLYDTNRNGGLWLGARYGGKAWRVPPVGGTHQSSTAGALAAFMTLLIQSRLVTPEASEKMRGMMQKPNPNAPGTGSWFEESIAQLSSGGNIRVLLCKVGLYKGADECAYVERKVTDQNGNPVQLCYVAVGLRAKHSDELKSLILELDKCILANNGLTPAQGGHS